ncbi:hypothetical protein [Mesorhizobium ciceri]|uniref:hypothetical protein n=1 Tax=Mesorhizobium TaxID=68287 RepID=UPI003AF37664
MRLIFPWHALDLRADQPGLPALGRRKARTSRRRQRWNEQQEAPRYGHLDGGYRHLGGKHLTEDRRQPEACDRQHRDRPGDWVNDLAHGFPTILATV